MTASTGSPATSVTRRSSCRGDVRDPEQLDALFLAVDDRWGRVDTLVNVPGGTFKAPFLETNAKGWNVLLSMNLLHVLHASSLAASRMVAGGRGGSIVNLTTIECHRAAPGFAVYSAAKAAVEQFGRTLAVELGPDNIRVNNVAPDYTPTAAMEAMRGDVDPEADRRRQADLDPDGAWWAHRERWRRASSSSPPPSRPT